MRKVLTISKNKKKNISTLILIHKIAYVIAAMSIMHFMVFKPINGSLLFT